MQTELSFIYNCMLIMYNIKCPNEYSSISYEYDLNLHDTLSDVTIT